MTFPARLILAFLACYRLATLLAWDDGPYHLIDQFRRALGRNAARSATWKTVADLFHCPYCLGVWFALFLTPLIFLPTLPGDVFLVWWGIAGAGSVLTDLYKRSAT